ncbi:hypothetical protein [Corallococcus macrosporus]|nr:hypothetical protein [Corallococcus macrosporus]
MSTKPMTDEPAHYRIRCTKEGLYLCVKPGDFMEFINETGEESHIHVQHLIEGEDNLFDSDDFCLDTSCTGGPVRIHEGGNGDYQLMIKSTIGPGEPINGTITVSRGT